MSLTWTVRGRTVDLSRRPLVMGIVNATPDSFSDGGRYQPLERALAHIDKGADIVDVGGESTRPGSHPVPLDEELRRVLPVVEGLAASGRLGDALLSIDTSKAEVAERCLVEGAHIINDVTALRGDPRMGEVVRSFGAGVILMHMQGTPATMQIAPAYEEVVSDVLHFLEARLQACVDLGIAGESVVVDPGIGFGKTGEHNWTLLARLKEFASLGRPLCLGVSRKGFMGKLLGRGVAELQSASVAVALDAAMNGSAHIFRVHDVAATRDALLILTTLRDRREKSSCTNG